ncbi:TRAM domain-containing protein, partial [Sphingomonas sp.]|uniref:TRAM domain-containing protein n=3 Tax=unclassified Sphingomonas TaxID=196159 RepID=UPI0025FA6143
SRAGRLRAAAAARRAAWLARQVGRVQDVLLERPGDRGHAGNFAEVRLSTPASSATLNHARPGDIVGVRITAATDTYLIGTTV